MSSHCALVSRVASQVHPRQEYTAPYPGSYYFNIKTILLGIDIPII